MNTNRQFRVFTVRTAITLLVVLFANVTAWAVDPYRYRGVKYVLDQNTNTVYATQDEENIPKGNVQILNQVRFTSNGDLIPVTTIASSAFSGCGGVTKVTIPSTVTTIGSSAFLGCNQISEITIPASVTIIGNGAFDECSKLITVFMEGSVAPTFGYAVFFGCSSLKNIIVPEEGYDAYAQGLTESGDNFALVKFLKGNSLSAYSGYCGYCGDGNDGRNLIWRLTDESENGEDPDGKRETLTISGSGDMMDSPAPWYDYSSAITKIVIGADVTSIGEGVFGDCKNLATVTMLGYEPPALNGYPFDPTDTENFTIVIPKGAGINYCRWSQFWHEYADKMIHPDGTSPKCGNDLYWGFNLDDDKKEHLIIDGYNTNPDGVDDVYDMCYFIDRPWADFCEDVKYLEISRMVGSIVSYAFQGFTKLQGVSIPDNVLVIGESAFAGCTELCIVEMESSTPPDIAPGAFDYYDVNDGLTITVPVGTVLDYYSNENWRGYAYAITDMNGASAYRGYCGRSNVNYGQNVRWDFDPFNGNVLYIDRNGEVAPEGTDYMGNYDSQNAPWSHLRDVIEQVEIGSGVANVGSGAFSECTNLQTLYVDSDTPPVFGQNALYGCDALNTIVVPQGRCYAYCVTAEGWSDYASLIVEENEFGDRSNPARCGENLYWTWTVDETENTVYVTITGSGAMEDGKHLWDDSFSNYDSFSVTVPSGVSYIGSDAFQGYYYVTIESATPPTLGSDVFYGCPDGLTITVPAGSLNDYMSASGWSDYLFYLVDTEGRSPFSGYCGDPNEGDGKHVSWFFERDTGILTISTEDSGSWKMANFTSKGAPWYHLRSNIQTLSFAYNDNDAYLTTIGNNAFSNCNNLQGCDIPATVATIGEYAFYGTNLEDLFIPYSVTKINGNAFANNSRLAHITLERETPPAIDKSTFSGCSIENVFMPFPYIKNYKKNRAWVQYEDKFTPTCWFVNDGTESDPFVIEAPEQLDHVAELIRDHKQEEDIWGYRWPEYATNCYYVLGNDIQYTYKSDNDNNFTAIGDESHHFEGHFDGGGHTISGIRIYKAVKQDADSYQGLFGYVNSGAEVKNVTLDDCRITGYKYVGGIAGRNDGTITGCRVTNTVTVDAHVGDANNHAGIAGFNDEPGTIQDCISSATVSMTSMASRRSSIMFGAIVGNNAGSLKRNLAVGATVAKTYKVTTYGVIAANGTVNSSFEYNYYSDCKIASTDGVHDAIDRGLGDYAKTGYSGPTDLGHSDKDGALHVYPGDANGDDKVSVTDIAVVVNYILSLTNSQFYLLGADANHDLNVTVTDIGVIVDMILGNSGGNASARRMTDEGPEPQ